jgi:hypothetical protein
MARRTAEAEGLISLDSTDSMLPNM